MVHTWYTTLLRTSEKDAQKRREEIKIGPINQSKCNVGFLGCVFRCCIVKRAKGVVTHYMCDWPRWRRQSSCELTTKVLGTGRINIHSLFIFFSFPLQTLLWKGTNLNWSLLRAYVYKCSYYQSEFSCDRQVLYGRSISVRPFHLSPLLQQNWVNTYKYLWV